MGWQSWSATDVGTRRAYNEDALVVREDDGLWAVIDGLGGADAGNVASAAMVHALTHPRLAETLPDAVDQLEDVLLAVHEQLQSWSASQTPARLLGCTAAVLRLTPTWGLLFWVGDVRLYRWRQGELTCLSEDHVSQPQRELTRLIGSGELLPDMQVLVPCPGDRYLLCSDGLHGEVSEARLAWWLARDPATAQRELVAEALAAGGHDNLSLVLVTVDDEDESPDAAEVLA